MTRSLGLRLRAKGSLVKVLYKAYKGDLGPKP